jgi:glutamyl-tRNA synthetase
VPLVQERMTLLTEAVGMLSFLYADVHTFAIDAEAAAKQLGDDARPILDAALVALQRLDEWTPEGIESALRAALIDGLSLKPKTAFGAVRVAITGRTVSPPLFESIALLGRAESLRRISAARSS